MIQHHTFISLYTNISVITSGKLWCVDFDMIFKTFLIPLLYCVCVDTQSYDYGEDLGVTAVALYDYQAGE